ncbi:MAG: hypothetical protein A2W21_15125 [Betaproteobacteria bacterium RBG_16_66_20]|nr:MAG: hypothetical protein A2W21_15125 [Betaproteobacteria bacterium RBG_16_66_20]
MKQSSPSCERNKDPILAVLKEILPRSGLVLEIGSGTGQHAAYFAAHLPQLIWQPTDLSSNFPSIRAEACGACVHPCMRRVTHSYRKREYSERRHYRAAL